MTKTLLPSILNDSMEEALKSQMREFTRLCYLRLEDGAKTHRNAYEKLDLYDEMMQELADVANYAFMEYVKIVNLKSKKDLLLKDN